MKEWKIREKAASQQQIMQQLLSAASAFYHLQHFFSTDYKFSSQAYSQRKISSPQLS